MLSKRRKIGEILIENNFITKDILDKALEYQSNYGGNITQYLIAYGYVTEEDMAKCVSKQFGYPYLPLRAYDIPPQIIKLVPYDIAAKYWLIPVDRIGPILTVVMADPLDEDAVKDVEKVTGCDVQPFVGILSDIINAIEHYYNVPIQRKDAIKGGRRAPLFISTNAYKGLEHRKSIRLKAKIEIHFPAQDLYKKSETKDISLHGFLFESQNILPIGSFVVLEIDLPKEFSPHPIAVVVQVVRVVPLADKRFDIGAKTISMLKEDVDKVMRYALKGN